MKKLYSIYTGILISLLVASTAFGSAFPGTVDLLSPTGIDTRKLMGGSSGDMAGYAIAGGDIDGDGYDDVIIGAYGDDPVMRSNAGMVNVVFGGPSAITDAALDLGNPPAGVLKIYGDDSDDNAGYACACGDINGDGKADIIIGAPGADPEGRSSAGEVYIILGSTTLKSTATLDLGGLPAGVYRIYGDDANDHCGFALSTGDVNADGYDDVIIGAPDGDPAGGSNAGETYVYFGSSSLQSANLHDPTQGILRIYGDDADDLSGKSVSTGDFDNDGLADIVIGAPGADPVAGSGAGETYVIWGTSPLKTTTALNLNTSYSGVLVLSGERASSSLGTSTAAGDVNGDGYEDLVSGAFTDSPDGRTAAGTCYVVYGSGTIRSSSRINLASPSVPVTEIWGDEQFDGLGKSIAIGDTDGNQQAEIVIGAYSASPAGRNDAGALYIVSGSTMLSDTSKIDLAESNTSVSVFHGEAANDLTGEDVETMDINGDGLSDVAVGAAGNDPLGRLTAGAVFLAAGIARPGITSTSPVAMSNAAPGTLVRATFNTTMNTSLTSVLVSGTKSGIVSGSTSMAGLTLTFYPTVDFTPGETVTVTVNGESQTGVPIETTTWSFDIRLNETPPYPVSHVPTSNERHVSLNQDIVITFPEDIDKDETSVAVTKLPLSVLSLSSTWEDVTLTLDSNGSFAEGDSIAVLVEATDIYGVQANYEWRFYIREDFDPPEYSLIVQDNPSLMSRYSPINLVFTGDVDKSSFDASLSGSVSGVLAPVWTWLDSTVTAAAPSGGYEPGEQLTLIFSAADTLTNVMPETTETLTIKTRETAPVIVSRSPGINEVNVAIDAPITIEFSSTVQPDSTTVTLETSSSGAISTGKSWDGSTVTLIPTGIAYGDTVIVRVNAGDNEGNRMLDTWTYYVKADGDPPLYTLSVPEDNGIIPRNATFSLHFPRDVDKTSVSVDISGTDSGTIHGSRSWADTVYTIIPGGDFTSGELITLVVNARDTSDNAIPEQTHEFTVGSYGPWVMIDAVRLYNEQNHVYRIEYTVDDPDKGYTVTTGWEYTTGDGNWRTVTAAQISGNESQAPGQRVVYWTLSSELRGVYAEAASFRMKVSDGTFISLYGTSPPFEIDWNEMPTVSITTAAADYLTNTTRIDYQIGDYEQDVIDLLFEYTLDEGEHWIEGHSSTNITDITHSMYNGTVMWPFTDGLESGIEYTNVQVRLTPYDHEAGITTVSDTLSIDLNAPPTVFLDPVTGVQSGSVAVSYEVTDAESDSIRFACSYSVDGGLNWNNTPNITPTGYTTAQRGTIVWRSKDDIPVVDTDTARLRIVPWDNDPGTEDVTGNFRLSNNSPPKVTVAVQDTIAQSVTVPFEIQDWEGDAVTLHPMWSRDGENWRQATVEGDTLSLAASDYTGTLTWNTREDLGNGLFTDVQFRLLPTDEQNTLADGMNNYAGFTIDIDNEAPTVLALRAFTNGDTLYYSLNETVATETVLNHMNYELSGDLSVAQVQMGSEPLTYFLRLGAGQSFAEGDYTLTTKNLADQFGNVKEQSYNFSSDDTNVNPTVALGIIPQASSGLIILQYRITDPEGDPVTLAVQYTTDDGDSWHDATVMGDLTNLTGEAYEGGIVWQSDVDLPGTVAENMRVRVIPADRQEGLPVMTNVFVLNNNLPPSISLSVEDTGEFLNDMIDVDYILFDNEQADLTMTASYSDDGGLTYSAATIMNISDSYPPSAYSGTLSWNSMVDFPGKYGDIRFRVSVSDGYGTAIDSLDVRVDNYGVSRVAVTMPGGEQTGDVTIGYEISDRNGNDVTLAALYSSDGGTTWLPATISGAVNGLSPDKYSGSFTWLAGGNCDGYEGTVKLRVVPTTDIEGIAGSGEVYVDFNEAPTVTSVTHAGGELSGNVTVTFTIDDPEEDTVTPSMSYTIDGGENWYEAEISGSGGVPGNGSEQTLTWLTGTDLPGLDIDNIIIRISAADFDEGTPYDSGPVHIDNNQPPAIQISVDDPELMYSSPVTVSYVLSDIERNRLNLTPRYSLDEGTTWNPATVTGKTENISSLSYSGNLVWDIVQDIDDYRGTVQFGIIPSDNDEGTIAVIPVQINTAGVSAVTAELASIQETTVTISYVITETKNNPVNLTPEFSIDDGDTWGPVETEDILTNIPPEAFAGTFDWEVASLLAGYQGNVSLRITPDNGYDGTPVIITFAVDYNEPPVIENLYARQDSLYAGIVDLPFTISDSNGDDISVTVEWSTDDESYLPCTLIGDPVIEQDGSALVRWNAMYDLGYGENMSAYIHVVPYDSDEGTAVKTPMLTITSRPGDFSADTIIDGDDIPGFIDAWNTQDSIGDIGPAIGVPPSLTVQSDGAVDFEDLAVFVLMFNWSVENSMVTPAPAKTVPPVSNGTDITLTTSPGGYITVETHIPADYLSLFVTYDDGEPVTIIGGRYFTNQEAPFVLNHDAAGASSLWAGVFDSPGQVDEFPLHLADIKCVGAGVQEEPLTVTYRLRETDTGIYREGSFLFKPDHSTWRPNALTLKQNMPNPFNPTTTIEFGLPEESMVTLRIYTLTGQLVEELVKSSMSAGYHSVTWDASSRPSGVYLYTLQAGNRQYKRKMLLLK